MGPKGLREVGLQALAKSRYAAERLAGIPGYRLPFKEPFVKEFVVECPVEAARVVSHAGERGILAGVDLGRFDPSMSRRLLVAVTEKRTRGEIDDLARVLAEVKP
jgi:glycine dehydrogenase subunit 1